MRINYAVKRMVVQTGVVFRLLTGLTLEPDNSDNCLKPFTNCLIVLYVLAWQSSNGNEMRRSDEKLDS